MSEPKHDSDTLASSAGDQPAAKRVKTEDAGTAEALQEAAKSADIKPEALEEEDDDVIPLPVSTTRSAVKKGHECPYLDTILRQQVTRLDTDVTWVRALDGSEYMPGLVGLNNMKYNDYANVVVQVLARVSPI
eukprot:gene13914-14033_t